MCIRAGWFTKSQKHEKIAYVENVLRIKFEQLWLREYGTKTDFEPDFLREVKFIFV